MSAADICDAAEALCSRCGADTKDDPQVFVLCDRCYGATTQRPAPPAPAIPEAVREAAEIVCPETLSAERRCGACPTCWCIAEAERLRTAIQAHHDEFERLALRPDPADYDLWAALSSSRPPEQSESERELCAIDALLDRRDVFDGLQSRYDKILLSLRVNERTDPKGEVALSVRRCLLASRPPDSGAARAETPKRQPSPGSAYDLPTLARAREEK